LRRCRQLATALDAIGIGPADHLSSLGIPVVLDASEVGRNLQNHPSYALRYACSQIRSMPGAKR
jgi:choline dehydrogenase-like flavoprotein